jgi:2-dehydropantoate 2-reductase
LTAAPIGMRILVFGAGAVGGHLAARLALGGHDVCAYVRGPAAAAIARDGLVLRAGEQEWRAPVKAATRPRDVPAPDLVLVTLKAHALPAARAELMNAAGSRAPILFAANGLPWWYGIGATGALRGFRAESLDPGGALAAAIAPARLLGGVVYSANVVEAPGVVRHVSLGLNRLVIGAPAGAADVTALAASLGVGGLDIEPTDDIRAAVWNKLFLNVAFNPVAMLTGARFGVLLDDAGIRELAMTMLEEAMAIAVAAGVTVPRGLAGRLLDPGQPGREHKASMLQDLEAGRRTELDAVLGAVVALARTLGVAVPTLETVLAVAAARASRSGLQG